MSSTAKIEIITVKDFEKSIAASNFHRWHTDHNLHYWPTVGLGIEQFDQTIKDMFEQFAPKSPLWTHQSHIAAMGSCFAMRIKHWLRTKQKNSDTIFIPEGLNNTFAVRQYIEWVLTGNRSLDAYCYDQNDTQGIHHWESTEEQTAVREKFIHYDGFIITYGLAEVWRDRKTQGVFWRGVPEDIFDPARHECVMTTVEQNTQNIQRTIELLQEHCGAKPIVITLSPVPLNATFLARPCVVSDCVSKSNLRVAIDQALQNQSNTYYWPSFEFVRWLPPHTGTATFGGMLGDKPQNNRHVHESAVATIIENFDRCFFAA